MGVGCPVSEGAGRTEGEAGIRAGGGGKWGNRSRPLYGSQGRNGGLGCLGQ